MFPIEDILYYSWYLHLFGHLHLDIWFNLTSSNFIC